MGPPRRRFRRGFHLRQRDERGATFVLTAICMVLLLSAGAFGVDLGFTVDGGRQAQSLADTAALDMARYINIADAQITLTKTTSWLTTNKLPYVDTDNGTNTTLTVVPGEWSGTAWSTPTLGCETASPYLPLCNAVKITASQIVPQIFGGGNSTVSRTAIAAVTPEAGFSIGSYLVSINSQQSGVLNALLSTLGTSANVTAVGFEGLANTNVTLSQLITASGGILTPSNVMTTSLTGAQWLTIWNDAVSNQVAQLSCGSSPTPYPCDASTALSALDFSSADSVELCQLVTINSNSSQSTACATPPTSALNASVNALQTLETEAELANGTNAINVTSALGITGVTSANLYLTVGSPPAVAYGPVGTKASTAQVNADLQLSILGSGLLDVPLSGAGATATLSTVTCSNNKMYTTKIALSGSAISNQNITLAGLALGQMSFSSFSGTLPFASSAVPPTATTAQQDTNPVSSGSTTPTLVYSGTSNPVLTALAAGVLAPVLQTVGVAVGGAQTTDLSTNCGAVSLVQ